MINNFSFTKKQTNNRSNTVGIVITLKEYIQKWNRINYNKNSVDIVRYTLSNSD